jgi:hypothetical protein
VNTINDNVINNPPVEDDLDTAMIKAYIGPKANKMYDNTMKGRGINIFAIIFTYFYMLYRKMYGQAVAAYIVVTILVSFIPDILGLNGAMTSWFNGVMTFLPGFFFYPLYRRHVLKKTDRIKAEIPGLNYKKLVAAAGEQGGTNPMVTAIFAILYLVFMIAMIAAQFGFSLG